MIQKKIMILGGSPFQIPLIRKAKEMGLYVISCDYLPDNPGHAFSDEYINISTTDKFAVLEKARKLNIDAISTLSSDPAIPTVAYVANALGLKGPSPKAIATLTQKDLFRSLLQNIDLSCPQCFVTESAEIPEQIKDSRSKFVVKPIDSCGSKGVTFSTTEPQEITCAIQHALAHSRMQKCILEEYIEGDQIHGDGYLHRGELIYKYLGDHVLYTDTNSFIPISTRWPSKFGSDVLINISRQIEAIALASGYTDGPVNIEARITPTGKVYIIEAGPRNGGNYVPIIQEHLTGFDFVTLILQDALGETHGTFPLKYSTKVGAHYILHSERNGTFKHLEINDKIKNHIFFYRIFKNKGDAVFKYTGSNTTIGVLLLEFSDIQERNLLMNNIQDLVKLEVYH